MRLLKVLAATVAICLAPSAFGEEDHHLTPVTGTHQIDLKMFDHAIAGSIKDFVVFANKDGATSELTIKKDGQLIRTTFGRATDSSPMGGTLTRAVDGLDQVTTLTLVHVDVPTQTFAIKVNEEVVQFRIENEGMDGNHHINPRFIATFRGQPLEWKIESGSACLGCAVHIAFWILGAVAL